MLREAVLSLKAHCVGSREISWEYATSLAETALATTDERHFKTTSDSELKVVADRLSKTIEKDRAAPYNGWIEWKGGECPGDFLMYTITRSGRVSDHSAESKDKDWSHGGRPTDIIAYHIVT